MQRRRTHLVRFGCAFLALQVGVLGARAGQLPPPPPPPPPPPSMMSMGGPLAEMPKGAGFVLGQVRDAGTGQPVPGAIVSITGFGALPGGVPGGAQAVAPVTSETLRATAPRRVITDRSGRFFFRELAGGRFGISVTAAGYIPGGYLQKKPGGTPHFLDLGQDEKRGDVQIQLWKFASMTGTVLDEAGEPAVGVMVRTFRRTMSGGRLRLGFSSTATTDDRGVYRLANLSPGDYLVGITATQSTIPAALGDLFVEGVLDTPPPAVVSLQSSGVTPVTSGFRVGDLILQAASNRSGYVTPQPGDDGAVLSYLTTFFPSAPAPAQATVITLGSGEERTGLDLPLKLVRTVRVSGVVVDPDGPAGNIGLRLMPASTDEFATEGGIEVATTATDPSGAFTFLGVPAGQYTLKVLKTPRGNPVFFNAPSSDGFTAAFTEDAARARAAATGPPAATLWASLPVTVGTTDVPDIAVTLKPGLRASGRVEFAGTKTPPTEQELARGSVTLTPLSPRPSSTLAPTRMTAGRQFTTAGYPPSKYLVSAAIPVPGWTLLSIMHGSRDVADEPLDLEMGDVSGLVITFTDQATELSGTIVDAKGAAHPTAEIITFPADSETWKQGAFSPRRIRLTPGTKSGTYAVPGLPPGQYFVVAVDESATAEWQDPRFLERLQRSATRVTLQAGEKKTQALTLVVVR